MPLAPVVRPVAARSEPVAEGGYRCRVELPHGRVVTVLCDAVGLGDSVQRRVLTGEQRGSTRDACRGPRVMAVQFQTTFTESLSRRQLGASERCDLVRLLRRRIALLVGHDQQNVRGGHARRLLPPARVSCSVTASCRALNNAWHCTMRWTCMLESGVAERVVAGDGSARRPAAHVTRRRRPPRWARRVIR